MSCTCTRPCLGLDLFSLEGVTFTLVNVVKWAWIISQENVFSTLLFPGPVAHIFTIISSFTKQETSNQVNTGNIYRHLQLSTVMSLRSLHHLVLPGHDPLGGGEESSKAFPLNASSSSRTFPLGSRRKLCRMQAAIASVDTFSGSRLILRWKNLSSTGMPEYQKRSQPPEPRSWESVIENPLFVAEILSRVGSLDVFHQALPGRLGSSIFPRSLGVLLDKWTQELSWSFFCVCVFPLFSSNYGGKKVPQQDMDLLLFVQSCICLLWFCI